MKHVLKISGLLVLILSLAGCSPFQQSSSIVLKGEVETQIIAHYSEVSGKIVKLPIELGKLVKAGDVIAEIDDSNEQYALEQLKAGLAKKQAALADLKSATDPAEIKQGENNVTLAQKAIDRAQLASDRAQKDYDTAQTLLSKEAIAQASLDDAKYKADLAQLDLATAQTQLDNASQKLVLLNKGADQEKIASAQADIDLTQSQIRQEEERLTKFKIKALGDGTIISSNFGLGAIVSPGSNLADIAVKTEKYLVAYLPEEYLPKVDYGQELVVRNGKEEYKGTVSFIDLEAQYTPKDMQTSANKNKDSVKIKVRLAEDSPLKVGESAELLIDK
ncbi:HlyD family secretion protein [Desulfitobacterium metallireducens]|uniref:Secretion protein HlyD n=1 Tax=Desulfitobacterium metallireducens DSM 15288 TaxID=871968 RepID=W0E9B2_9FIRM|nr:HlyD family efflux transporter periplasmic adaptor subunit [Desulfitobacterium metallireducens]AHF06113.1 secretion protein HlyD [Desulfitobacterium metallireducens DSM 15288]